MKNYYSYFNKRVSNALKKTLLLAIVVWTGNSIHIANAQNLDPQKMTAVMTIINMYVLDNDKSISLDLGQVNQGTFSVNKEFTIEFEQQAEEVELCFIYTNRLPANADDPVVTLNGANLIITDGENCFTIPVNQQQVLNVLLFDVTDLGGSIRLKRIGLEPSTQTQLTLPLLTRSGWDEKAARKVLKIFAFGGHARTAQIKEWANMRPKVAIAQMLNFAEHNLKLSPLLPGESYPQTATQYGTLVEFVNFLSSPDSDLPIPVDEREQFDFFEDNFDSAFAKMVTARGLNPFRQKIGFWETNYHLAVNRDTAVNSAQIATYYDQIMDLHEKEFGYRQVIGAAARSAAVATQYGHRNNRWVNNRCRCNDDFAREIHQLFYGIFGEYDPLPNDGISGPDYHESVTIPNTAKMLTDMRVNFLGDELTTNVVYGTAEHHVAPLEILGKTVVGANAREKIGFLMFESIQHPESKQNLPIMIISGLADDNLTEQKKDQLRAAWEAMPPVGKNFLDFIHSYAISDLFHDSSQFKYLTSHERALYKANKFNLDNTDSLISGNFYGSSVLGGRAGIEIDDVIEDDRAGEVFRPLNNVFGAQAPTEAADSALAFENNYDQSTEQEQLTRQAVSLRGCSNAIPNPNPQCISEEGWEKQWAEVLPALPNGRYRVSEVAEWLWVHTVGSLENYTLLERAHLYAILGSPRNRTGQSPDVHEDEFLDFPALVCLMEDYVAKVPSGNTSLSNLLSVNVWGNYCVSDDEGGQYTTAEMEALNRHYTGDDINDSPELLALVQQLGSATMGLNPAVSTVASWRQRGLERVNAAMNFIFATPFVFAEGSPE